jgi:hypothetical protein
MRRGCGRVLVYGEGRRRAWQTRRRRSDLRQLRDPGATRLRPLAAEPLRSRGSACAARRRYEASTVESRPWRSRSGTSERIWRPSGPTSTARRTWSSVSRASVGDRCPYPAPAIKETPGNPGLFSLAGRCLRRLPPEIPPGRACCVDARETLLRGRRGLATYGSRAHWHARKRKVPSPFADRSRRY